MQFKIITEGHNPSIPALNKNLYQIPIHPNGNKQQKEHIFGILCAIKFISFVKVNNPYPSLTNNRCCCCCCLIFLRRKIKKRISHSKRLLFELNLFEKWRSEKYNNKFSGSNILLNSFLIAFFLLLLLPLALIVAT